jgi:hypothetical protein
VSWLFTADAPLAPALAQPSLEPFAQAGTATAMAPAREALVLVIRLAGHAPSRLRPFSSNVLRINTIRWAVTCTMTMMGG